jgi:hypothetical protein
MARSDQEEQGTRERDKLMLKPGRCRGKRWPTSVKTLGGVCAIGHEWLNSQK